MRHAMFLAGLLALSSASFAPTAEEPPKQEMKPDNSIISDFIDNTAKYKGKTVAIEATFLGGDFTLRELVGGIPAIFTAKDPNDGAKLRLAVDVPKGLDVPDAKTGELVVIVFKCGEGAISKGNVAIAVTRPKKAKK